jgi:hypothetical protein
VPLQPVEAQLLPNSPLVTISLVGLAAPSFASYNIFFLKIYHVLIVSFIGKSLGKGTFGKVKLATHTLTGEKVCYIFFFQSDLIGCSENSREGQNKRQERCGTNY